MSYVNDSSMRQLTITIDKPSKLSPADAKKYGILSNLDHLKFFSGVESNPFTPPILQFSTPPPPPNMDPMQDHIPTAQEEALQILFDELKKQLPDDFRRNRYRRQQLQKHSMNSLAPSTRQRLNRRKKQHQQQGNTNTADYYSLAPDDPSILFSDTQNYILRLLREVDIETRQNEAIKKALREAELEEAGNVLKWKKQLDDLKEENRLLLLQQQQAPSASASASASNSHLRQ